MAQPLTNLNLNDFEALLTARVADLERLLGCRDLIVVEQTADDLGQVQRAADRALVVSNLDRDSRQLREARRALARIGEGTFGICEECGEEIPIKRLRAVPLAAFCIQCQEEQDREQEPAGHYPEDGTAAWLA